MRTISYRIRIEALGPKDEVICAMEQTIEQETLKKSRPRLLIRFVEKAIRTFLRGHTAAEKRLAAGSKRRPRLKKLGLEGLLEQHNRHA